VSFAGPDDRASIAVAGGGIIGLSIAWRLAQAGHNVTVFDQRTVGGEASWAGAGMLAPGGEIEEPSAIAALAIESRGIYSRFVRELEDASELPIDYQECGALDIAYSEDELAALERRGARQRDLGVYSKRITRAHVATFWPRVRRDGLVGGRFYPNDAIVNPRELTHALKCVCCKAGVTVREYCLVRAIAISPECVSLRSSWDYQDFRVVVIAAGAWSSLIAVSGVPDLPKAEPIKGHLIGYQQPEQTCNTIIRHGHTYLLQRGNGLLIAGSSIERVGFDRDINPFIETDLAKRAGFVLPHLGETSPSETWMGFRPASDDLRMGMWHSPRLCLAYGHFRNGILLAPVTAARVAAEVNASLQMQ
jgi:glycine oxidase